MKFFTVLFVTVAPFVLLAGCQSTPEHELQREWLAMAERELSEDEFEELIYDIGTHPVKEQRVEFADGSVYKLDRFSDSFMKESEGYLEQVRGPLVSYDRLWLYQEADADNNFHISRSEARSLRDRLRAEASEVQVTYREIGGILFTMEHEAALSMGRAEDLAWRALLRSLRFQRKQVIQDMKEEVGRDITHSEKRKGLREAGLLNVYGTAEERREVVALRVFREADQDGDRFISKKDAKIVLQALEGEALQALTILD